MSGVGVRIRVLSYNLHGLRDDPAALARLVREVGPDVLVAQEAPRRFRWRTRCAALARELDLLYAAGGGPALGNLILVSHRVRVHRAWYLRFPLTPGRHLRGAAFVRASIGRVPFVVAGSHLSTDPAERRAQAYQLADALRGNGNGDGDGNGDAGTAGPDGLPLVLGVDLNEPPGGPAWQALAALSDAAGAPAGADVPTFPAAAPRVRIDAVLVSPSVRVHRVWVPDDATARRASDHLPVVAEVAVAEPDPVAG